MSDDPNIFVNNGTCYSAPGERLDGSFIPCGNDAIGHQTCCGAGDNCLSNNACFGIHGEGYGSYLTYMAGCTDPDYEDQSCPDKRDIGERHEAEMAVDRPHTLRRQRCCTDTSETTVAFSAGTRLTNIASLPESTGESIQFFAGHFPTSPESPPETTSAQTPSSDGNTTAASMQTGSTTPSLGTTPTQTAGLTTSSRDATPTQTGSTTSSQGGTSAGDSSTSSPSGTGGDKKPPADIPDPTAPEADGQAVSEADGRAAQPWSLKKAELEGSQPLPPPPSNGKTESGSGAVGCVIKPYRKDPTVPEVDGQPVAEADGRAISAEEIARRGQVVGGGNPHEVSRVRRNAEFGPVAELPGGES
ncbi:hypothetical protein DL766_000514 [Monosporascus sp. MC13-8B]|uniref:Uncharacterized protein n=1 Tax=Monosporascus cannonballus TaxID=155416 RepID=A0ABY0GT52_9PEZI|nr:hypothetical protein DL762_010462 [Monosporascus cannonballus]RYO76417.1 hypothetical protein DL763_010495 [Monosporascus cannonballus]RYP39256.1 hypothetical protein DL766_000514 [Monosporascus sp. MC13-8B]